MNRSFSPTPPEMNYLFFFCFTKKFFFFTKRKLDSNCWVYGKSQAFRNNQSTEGELKEPVCSLFKSKIDPKQNNNLKES